MRVQVPPLAPNLEICGFFNEIREVHSVDFLGSHQARSPGEATVGRHQLPGTRVAGMGDHHLL